MDMKTTRTRRLPKDRRMAATKQGPRAPRGKDINSCVFTGTLIGDPEVCQTKSGTCVVNALLGVAGTYGGGRFWLELWGPVAVAFARTMYAGDRVIVAGSASIDEWTTAQGRGRRRIVFNITQFTPAEPENDGDGNEWEDADDERI